MELHLLITGYLLITLSVVHIVFPKWFNWEKELTSVSLINKQMMYVHTFFIGFTLLLMGIFCIYCGSDIIHTKLGRQISLGFSVFWGVRLLFQFFVYSPKLWKGKPFETVMHVLFSLLWCYFTVVFFLIFLRV